MRKYPHSFNSIFNSTLESLTSLKIIHLPYIIRSLYNESYFNLSISFLSLLNCPFFSIVPFFFNCYNLPHLLVILNYPILSFSNFKLHLELISDNLLKNSLIN